MIKREGSGRSSGGKSRFEYKERSADDVKKRAEQTGGRFDSIFKQGFDTFRAKEGENVLRILPPTWSDHDHYAYDLYVHSRIGPDNSDYLCLRKMKGEPCPICAASEEAKEAGEADEAKALQPSKKVAMWVVDRDSDAKDPTPAIYAISWMADRDIAALCHDKRKGKVLLIDHPDDGYDLIIKRHGQGLKTRYTYSIDRESSPIDDDPRAQDDVLDFVQETPIPDTLQYRDSEYLEKVLAGSQAEKDKDLDEDGDKDKDDRRSRRRDDDDGDNRSSRRSRSREDDDKDERKSSGRERITRDDEDRSSRRSRDKDEEDDKDKDDDRSSRRSRSRDDDDDKSSRRRDRDDKEDKGDEDERSSRRGRDKDEDEDRSSRRRGRDEEEDKDEEKDDRSRRRRDTRDEDGDKDNGKDDGDEDRSSRRRNRR
jgi:hypothetical protein